MITHAIFPFLFQETGEKMIHDLDRQIHDLDQQLLDKEQTATYDENDNDVTPPSPKI